jgi:GNAT superfamily N-acetyltransferase
MPGSYRCRPWSNSRMTIDAELIRRWQRGWSLARSLPEAEPVVDGRVVDGSVVNGRVLDGIRVRCDLPSRDAEVFALRADEEPASVNRLAAAVAADPSNTWLTVATHWPEEVAGAVEAAGLAVLFPSEQLMTTDLTVHPRRAPAAPYHREVRTEGPVVTVTLRHASGEQAARGTIAVVGADAVADRIETAEAHRRRGLGSVLMGTLAEAACARGARTGLLIASGDGQRLYTSLGWHRRADVLIAHAPKAPR